MSTFDMNNATDVALKMDVYAIYLCKSRADLEAEKLGEGETLARHKKDTYRVRSKNAIDEALGYEIIWKKKKSS